MVTLQVCVLLTVIGELGGGGEEEINKSRDRRRGSAYKDSRCWICWICCTIRLFLFCSFRSCPLWFVWELQLGSNSVWLRCFRRLPPAPASSCLPPWDMAALTVPEPRQAIGPPNGARPPLDRHLLSLPGRSGNRHFLQLAGLLLSRGSALFSSCSSLSAEGSQKLWAEGKGKLEYLQYCFAAVTGNQKAFLGGSVFS